MLFYWPKMILSAFRFLKRQSLVFRRDFLSELSPRQPFSTSVREMVRGRRVRVVKPAVDEGVVVVVLAGAAHADLAAGAV